MTKFKKIFVALSLALLLVTVAACEGTEGIEGPEGPQGEQGEQGPQGPTGPEGPTGPTGPQGPAGEDGEDGAPGEDGEDGAQGPAGEDGEDGAQGPVGEDGREVEFDVVEGVLQWRYVGDEAWEDLVDLEDFLVVQQPDPVTEDFMGTHNLLLVDGTTLLVGDDVDATEFTMAEDVRLFDSAGTSVLASGLEDVEAELDGFVTIADVRVVDDEVTRFRMASLSVAIDETDEDVVTDLTTPTTTTSGPAVTVTSAGSIELFYGTTVEDLMASIESEDGRDQEYQVYDDEGDAFDEGVIDYGFELGVTNEHGDFEYNYPVTFDGNPEDLTVELTYDPADYEYGEYTWFDSNDVDEVYVRPGTTQSELAGILEFTNEDYTQTMEIFNSELEAKTSEELATGDKVILTAVDESEQEWIVKIVEDDNAQLYLVDDADASLTANEVTVPWEYTVADFAADNDARPERTYSWEFDGEAVKPGEPVDNPDYDEDDDSEDAEPEYLFDGENLVNVLVRDVLAEATSNFELTITAEDGTTEEVYTFDVADSANTDLQVVTDEEDNVTAIDNENLEVHVRYDLTASELLAAIEANDESALTTTGVQDAEEVEHGTNDRLYTFDELVVESADGEETATYTIMVNDALTTTELDLVDDTDVITEVDHTALTLSVLAETAVDTDVTVSDIEDDILADQTNFKEFYIGEFDTDDEFEEVTPSSIEDMVVAVYAQDGETVAYYEVELVIETTTDLELAEDRVAIESVSGSVISTWLEKGNVEDGYTSVTYQDVIDEIDFNENYQTATVYDSSDDEITNLDQAVDADAYITVTAQDDRLDTDVDNTEDYTFDIQESSVINIELDEDAVFVTSRSNLNDSISAEYNVHDDDDAVLDATITDILGDIDFTVNFQQYALFDSDDNALSTSDDIEDLAYIRVYAQDHVDTDNENFEDYSFDLNKSGDTSIELVEDPVVIDDVSSGVIDVFPEFGDHPYDTTTESEIVADIDVDANFQESIGDPELFMVNPDYDSTDENSDEYIAWDEDSLDELVIQVTAADGSEEYYEVNMLDELSNTDVVEVEDQEVFTIEDDVITVEFGSAVSDLLGAIDAEANFQDVRVVLNDQSTGKTGDIYDNYYLEITAQDDTVEYYRLLVAEEEAAATVPSDDVSLDAITDAVVSVTGTNIDVYEITVADLIEALEDDDEDRTYEVVTSEGNAKDNDDLYTYDKLIITAEDGEETETYTITELTEVSDDK